MPELPEVETTVRGLSPHLTGRIISKVEVHESRLRWPVPANLAQLVCGQEIRSVYRRGKYILIELSDGCLLMHLGMSGSIRLSSLQEPLGRHDHVELEIEQKIRLRLRDPRRFGCVLWVDGEPLKAPLLSHLGVEPLSEDFDGRYLYCLSKNRRSPIKSFIMDSRVVVGIGNIYASEALHRCGINPLRATNRIALLRYQRLVVAVVETLQAAIAVGGTTLRDFVNGNGLPGYFQQELLVYGREDEPCVNCGSTIQRCVISQRSTYFCAKCQR